MSTTFKDSFINIVRNDNILVITYRVKNNIFYSKYFFPPTNENFYNENDDSFTLVKHIDGEKITLNSKDVIKIESIDKNTDEKSKNTFLKRAEKLKSFYQTSTEFRKSFSNFDNYFFNEDISKSDIKLAYLLEFTTIQGYLNNDENSLLHIKKIWKNKIESHKIEILNYLDGEIESNNIYCDIETIREIKDLIMNFDVTTELNSLKSKEEVFQYWPTLLLPAPDYVNEIYNLYINNDL
jgi:hypothetical protein